MDDRRAVTTFASLVEEFLSAHFDTYPSAGRSAGLCAYDGRVADRSRAALFRRLADLESFCDRLEGFDDAGLTPTERFERRCLMARSRFEIAQLREWRPFARAPLAFLKEMNVSHYVLRDDSPGGDRAVAFCLHLKGIPRLLDDAQELLDPVLDPTILDVSVRLFRGYLSYVEDGLVGAFAEQATDGNLRRNLLQARSQAAEAVRGFLSFLESRRPRAEEGRFAIGADGFRNLTRFGEGVDVDPEKLLALAEEDLDRNRTEFERIARAIDAGRAPRDVLAQVQADHPTREELLPAAARTLRKLRRFVEDADLVTVPSETPCEVRATPEFSRWAFALFEPPPMFAERDLPGIYYVTPPDESWSENRTESWLRAFSRADLDVTSIHEVWPGHFLQALHLRRAKSAVIRAFRSYSASEAWPHYCEQMMLDEGWGDGASELRLIQLRHALSRDVRLIAAVGMHARGLTVDQAQRRFERDAYLEPTAARAEAERGTFDPGYGNYTLGKLMLLRLRDDFRAARGSSFTLKGFHDAVLAYGASPLPLVREQLLGEGSAI